MKQIGIITAALCAGALTLAGCSSSGSDDKNTPGGSGAPSSNSSSGSAASSSSSSSGSFTGEPIKIGTIGPFKTSAFGNPQPEMESGAEAAVDGINSQGGINGHKLELVVCDDGYDPNKAADCGRKMVQEKVVAVVGSQTINYKDYGPIVEKAGITVMGGVPLGNADYSSTTAYPISPGAIGMFAGDVIAAKMAGKKSIYMVTMSVSGSDAQWQLIKGLCAATQMQCKGTGSIPNDSSDLTPTVQAATDSGADVVILGLDKVQTGNFLEAAESVGAKFTPAHALEAVTPSTLEAAPEEAEGMILASQFPPFDDTSFPALAEYNKEMDAREAAGDKAAGKENRQTVLATWLGIRAFAEVAKQISGDVTAQSVTAAMKTAKDIDLGLNGLKWSPSVRKNPMFKALSNTMIYFSTVKDGKVVLTQKQPMDVLSPH